MQRILGWNHFRRFDPTHIHKYYKWNEYIEAYIEYIEWIYKRKQKNYLADKLNNKQLWLWFIKKKKVKKMAKKYI